jgi:tetratricopeptide (TPR) repeat protein
MWTSTYVRPLDVKVMLGAQRGLAGEIATMIGQPYGVLNTSLGAPSASAVTSEIQSYLCVLRAYNYRRGFTRSAFEPALKCLEDSVRRDPTYSDAWALLAHLHLDAGRLEYKETGTQGEYEAALEASSRAVALDPNNPTALKAYSAAQYYLGRYDDAERILRHAMALNPHDPEVLALLGWRLSARGKLEEGVPLLTHAIERTVNPPGWYYQMVALDFYLRHDYENMLIIAEKAAQGDLSLS